MSSTGTTAVLEVSGVHWASSAAVTEAVLGRRPGVLAVDANPVSQTATVPYDPARTSVAALSGWVRDCGVPLRRTVRPRPCLRPEGRTHRPGTRRRPSTGRRPRRRTNPSSTARRARRARRPRRRREATLVPGRDGARRSQRRDVDGRHGPRHAEPILGGGGAVGAGVVVVADRPGGVRVHRAGPVRSALTRRSTWCSSTRTAIGATSPPTGLPSTPKAVTSAPTRTRRSRRQKWRPADRTPPPRPPASHDGSIADGVDADGQPKPATADEVHAATIVDSVTRAVSPRCPSWSTRSRSPGCQWVSRARGWHPRAD
jgi:copper chaperone CopZ